MCFYNSAGPSGTKFIYIYTVFFWHQYKLFITWPTFFVTISKLGKIVSLPLGKENCGQPRGHIYFQIVVSDHMYICAWFGNKYPSIFLCKWKTVSISSFLFSITISHFEKTRTCTMILCYVSRLCHILKDIMSLL